MAPSPPNLPGRPDFRLPFERGVRVELKTWLGHDPDDKKIDMYRYGMKIGSPIVASADGVVHEHFEPGGIEIRHGGGWFSTYMHMSKRVSIGTRVRRGDRVGTMGAVGASYPHLHYEQLYNPHSDQDADIEHIVNPVLEGQGPLVMGRNNPLIMVSTNEVGATGSATKYWVGTFQDAPVFKSATHTRPIGTLLHGKSYVFCKALGPVIRVGPNHNHWWLKTVPDLGQGQWVSAYYLRHWGNDEAKDIEGNVIPDC